ncbi:MAG: DUF4923 family protein [Prevotella sp.]|jgi:hypothetical protein
MTKINIWFAAIVCMVATSCGGLATGAAGGAPSSQTSSSTNNVFGGISGAMSDGETIANVLSSVIGMDKVSQTQLQGTWRYDGPGCGFTSENALAKAGGEVMATRIEEKLAVHYAKLGLNAQNTSITFGKNGSFSSKLGGRSWNGKYTYDAKTGAVTMQGLALSLNGFIVRNGRGISVLFESKKLLPWIRTMSALSGNQTLEAIGDISKNYDGVRLGFDMAK